MFLNLLDQPKTNRSSHPCSSHRSNCVRRLCRRWESRLVVSQKTQRARSGTHVANYKVQPEGVPMRKFALLLLLFALPVAACHHSGVKGSGKREVLKQSIEPFTSISTEGAFNVEVVCQKDLSLEIEADDNILPLIQVEVSHGVLTLK